MPKAEVGSIKHLANKMKAKGLQRLRWYCQVCEKQCRDENGFKCHTQSESHVRQMMVVGENARKHINDYSNQFQHDFMQLLRTAHGEKKVHANHFYQEYISNKEHIHMNATRWVTLTEFVKHLGRTGRVRVEDSDKGFFISWIDDSPENLRRQDAIRKKERQDKGDESREQQAIEAQIERARKDLEEQGKLNAILEAEQKERALHREEGEKIKISFGPKKTTPSDDATTEVNKEDDKESPKEASAEKSPEVDKGSPKETPAPKPTAPVKIGLGKPGAVKPKNVFAAAAKKSKDKKPVATEPPKKKMSEVERVMLEDMERKRKKEHSFGFQGAPLKKQRL
jgi:DNA/RNA-binding protein KIN17